MEEADRNQSTASSGDRAKPPWLADITILLYLLQFLYDFKLRKGLKNMKFALQRRKQDKNCPQIKKMRQVKIIFKQKPEHS